MRSNTLHQRNYFQNRKNRKWFYISISDTGRGIPDEAKSRIFQPFNQSNPEDASRYGGIGLGLYLCKMLTERMGGKIGFESTFGQGSTFWVQFHENLINPEANIN